MGRTPKRQNNHNNSLVNQNSTTNTSVLEEEIVEDYDEFIKRFQDLQPVPNSPLIGCETQANILKFKLELLKRNDAKCKPVDILLEGPMETGKTALVKQLAQQYQDSIHFFYLKASWLLTREFSSSRLRLLFEEASKKQPALIFIDDIDRLCPSKRQNETRESQMYDTLLDQMLLCKSNSRSKILIVAATNNYESIDARIRKCIKEEIQFNYPNHAQRVDALSLFLNNYEHQLDQATLSNLASNMACYSYPALEELCIKAYEIAEANGLKEIDVASFKKAQDSMKAATAKSVVTPCRKIRWSDIGGNNKVKDKLIKSVIWPIQYPEKYQKFGQRPPKGALLYGPPGCSKTMMAQALATESGFNFICIKGPELLTKWVGDSEAAVRKLYRNAKMIAPCIIFFDEFDGLASKRTGQSNNGTTERVVSQLLSVIDGVEPLEGVFTIAATNRPDSIDKAFLRPGRLQSVIYIPLPTRDERREIFDIYINKSSLPSVIDSDKLADRTDGYSGAEIMRICETACLTALSEEIETGQSMENIGVRHFEEAFNEDGPDTSIEEIKYYEKFRDRSRKSVMSHEAPSFTKSIPRRVSVRIGKLFKK